MKIESELLWEAKESLERLKCELSENPVGVWDGNDNKEIDETITRLSNEITMLMCRISRLRGAQEYAEMKHRALSWVK